MTQTSPEAVKQLESAVRAWSATADQIAREARSAVRHLVGELQSEVRNRGERLTAAEAALASARGDARAGFSRGVREADEALLRARRAAAAAKDAESRCQALARRMGDAATTRVPRASKDLQRKLGALAEYAGASGTGSTTGHSGSVGTPSSHPYLRLAGMIGIAVADQGALVLARTADQATANLPDRIGNPASAGASLYEEIRTNWNVYRLTPELIAMQAHSRKRS